MSETIIKTDIVDEMRDSYMEYAMSVIVGRALPDVRDGLKPVHRRVLYSMHEQGNEYNRPYRKSARVVGDVIGKYHPHGDQAAYDTIVRLTQDFSMRYQLVDGQGNFGSVDGDAPAAMRYTEIRLRRHAHDLMVDLEKDTVDFIPNYDDSLTEPIVLPTRIPNLLTNGSTGIAVGMACNMPPHNLREVLSAFLHYLDHRHTVTVEELMEHVQGPDFPTGGTIMGRRGIYEAYTTGRGIIPVRAKAHTETNKEEREAIIVTELPYMVNKANLIEKIAELVRDKKLEGISDLRDESDRKGMRIFIQAKRGENADVVLSNLYKHTAMQSSFGIIMLAIVDKQPKILTLPQMLEFFLQHRIEVVTRRVRFELRQSEERMHVLEGIMIALEHLDDLLELIRAAVDPAEAEAGLMEHYGLTKRQAKAILDLRLQRLTGMQQEEIRKEHTSVGEAIRDFQDILANKSRVLSIIREETQEIEERYGDERRTEITDDDGSILVEELINEEDMVVTFTNTGYVKRSPVTEYRVQRRGGKGRLGMGTKEEDFVEQMFVASTHDYLLFFTTMGQVFRKKVYELPQTSPTGRGKAVVNLLRLREGERVCSCLPVPKAQDNDHKYILLCTVQGVVKKTPMLDCARIRVSGVRAITLTEGDSLISAQVTNGNQELFFTSRNGMALRVHESTIRTMGRTARGVIGIRLKQGDRVVSAIALSGSGRLLTVTEKGYGKKTLIDDYALKKHRGNFGMRCMNVTEKNGPVVNTLEVEEHFQIFIITQQGKLIRTPVSEISTVGRVTQGNRLFHIAENDIVIDVASMIKGDEDEFPETPVAETQTELAEPDVAEAPETVSEVLQDELPLEYN